MSIFRLFNICRDAWLLENQAPCQNVLSDSTAPHTDHSGFLGQGVGPQGGIQIGINSGRINFEEVNDSNPKQMLAQARLPNCQFIW